MILNGNRNYELTRKEYLKEPVDIWTDICELTPVDPDDDSQDDSESNNSAMITLTTVLLLIVYCL